MRQSNDGKKHDWIRFPNGDGFLGYTGQAVGVEGAVGAIRLRWVREGLEEFEAMYLLGEFMDKAKKAGRSTAAGERTLALGK